MKSTIICICTRKYPDEFSHLRMNNIDYNYHSNYASERFLCIKIGSGYKFSNREIKILRDLNNDVASEW